MATARVRRAAQGAAVDINGLALRLQSKAIEQRIPQGIKAPLDVLAHIQRSFGAHRDPPKLLIEFVDGDPAIPRSARAIAWCNRPASRQLSARRCTNTRRIV
jgi:hypothetical protein